VGLTPPSCMEWDVRPILLEFDGDTVVNLARCTRIREAVTS
jgi:hypothetical protein